MKVQEVRLQCPNPCMCKAPSSISWRLLIGSTSGPPSPPGVAEGTNASFSPLSGYSWANSGSAQPFCALTNLTPVRSDMF